MWGFVFGRLLNAKTKKNWSFVFLASFWGFLAVCRLLGHTFSAAALSISDVPAAPSVELFQRGVVPASSPAELMLAQGAARLFGGALLTKGGTWLSFLWSCFYVVERVDFKRSVQRARGLQSELRRVVKREPFPSSIRLRSDSAPGSFRSRAKDGSES